MLHLLKLVLYAQEPHVIAAFGVDSDAELRTAVMLPTDANGKVTSTEPAVLSLGFWLTDALMALVAAMLDVRVRVHMLTDADGIAQQPERKINELDALGLFRDLALDYEADPNLPEIEVAYKPGHWYAIRSAGKATRLLEVDFTELQWKARAEATYARLLAMVKDGRAAGVKKAQRQAYVAAGRPIPSPVEHATLLSGLRIEALNCRIGQVVAVNRASALETQLREAQAATAAEASRAAGARR
jgi:hypothetical protein